MLFRPTDPDIEMSISGVNRDAHPSSADRSPDDPYKTEDESILEDSI